MKKLFLSLILLSFSTMTALAATAKNDDVRPVTKAQANDVVTMGYCLFEGEYSKNGILFSPENYIPATKGFHRLTVTNIQNDEFIITNVFVIHDWTENMAVPLESAPVQAEMLTLEPLFTSL